MLQELRVLVNSIFFKCADFAIGMPAWVQVTLKNTETSG